MSTSILERTRQAHEDIELYERGIVVACIDEPKNHRENVQQAHWVNLFSNKIMERSQQLTDIYRDADGSRKKEIQGMAGKGAQLFSNFYDQLRGIKEYHRKFPYLQVERPEAEQILNNTEIESLVQFSGEEVYGKYLDLHEYFDRYINLKGVDNNLDYVVFLDIFYKFPDKTVVKNRVYLKYIIDLYTYLVDFQKRTQPLFDVDKAIEQFETDFENDWSSENFVPIGYNEEDRRKESNPLWCKHSRKLFSNEIAYKNYLKSKRYKRAVKFYNEAFKQICVTETKINRLVSSFLHDQVDATKLNIEKKQARHYVENEADMQDDSDISSSSEDEEETRMTKENYPVGWDGNPIPYWLYKLHGLGIEYKCEICGNMSYWGRRAFERHFQEWRHAHGMKCLRLDNTKEFHEITKIQDALELNKKLKELKSKDQWEDETMQEFEDADGNVMNRKTFMDLRAQGLL